MEIKKSLKSMDVKISKLASDLGVSRPTLDTYIDYFEKGIKIPNDMYQSVFEYLFSDDHMTSIEFAQKYDYVKRIMLVDAKKGCELNLADKRGKYLEQNLCDLLEADAVNEDLLEFINLFVNHYNVELVQAICLYFNYTNGFRNIAEDEPSALNKAFFSQLSILFEKYRSKELELNEEAYRKLVQKNQAIFEKKKPKVTDDDIIQYIRNKISDPDSLDLNVLKQMIEEREDN